MPPPRPAPIILTGFHHALALLTFGDEGGENAFWKRRGGDSSLGGDRGTWRGEQGHRGGVREMGGGVGEVR